VRGVSRFLISAAGALLIAPLVVAAQALPANAATGKLLVTTISRAGQPVSSSVTAVLTNQSGFPAFGTSGRTMSLPDGQYAVLTGISDGATGTLAAAIVSVSGTGTTRVTLDARKGRLVSVTLDGKPVTGSLSGEVCALGGFGSASAGGSALYIVPNSSKVLNFSYLADGPGAILSGQSSSGVPAGYTAAWKTSQLAKLSATLRSGEEPSSATDYQLLPDNGPNDGITCRTGLAGSVVSGAPTPYSATELVSPGDWTLRTDDSALIGGQQDGIGGYFLSEHVAAGHAYSYTLYGATWAPRASLAEIRPNIVDFGFPTFADPGGNGEQAAEKATMTLSLAGHQLNQRTQTDWANEPFDFLTNTSKTGWYTLTVDESRYRPGLSFAGTLSPRATFAWRFYAAPSTVGTSFQLSSGFWPGFQPQGLSLANSAKPSSLTTVRILAARTNFDGVPAPADAITKMQAWSSVDGVHWTAWPVQRNSHAWYIVTVQNPAKGTVSLRVTITGSHGDTSTETVYRAYAIS
jgi:hypothetical protein